MKGWRGQQGTRQERGYGADWQRARAQALKRDNYLCRPCVKQGRITEAKAVDHIKPKSQGGTNEQSNLQSICDDCHATKTQAEALEARGIKPRPGYDAGGKPVWD